MTSACASSQATEYIQAAKEKGFAGMVFTNHFFRGNSAIDKTLPWSDFVKAYREDWLFAKQVGDRADIDVLFGIEEGYGNGKECLIYGLTPDIIEKYTDFSKMPINELSAFVRENGGFIACAHPFRVRGYITSPDDKPDMSLFDAMEVYNRGNTKEDNIKAEEYAKKCGCPVIAGGDVHSVSGFGNSGVAFEKRARTSEELVAYLRAGSYTLVRDEVLRNFGE